MTRSKLADLVVCAILVGCAPSDEKTERSAAVVCGDGEIGGDEACDDGPANDDAGACTSACQVATCGDGLVWAGVEDCDVGRGNSDAGSCTSACRDAACGDGFVWDGVEACDDGPANDESGACLPTCVRASCGDGLVRADVEECDHGPANDDRAACTSACRIAFCGDGWVWAGQEECDDFGGDDHDGCRRCRRPLTVDLAGADAVIVGEENDSDAGYSVSGAGDVDGDGYDDVIIGAYVNGRAYLVRGPVAGTVDLATADARFVGTGGAGKRVAGAGDVNGDGFDDLILGADAFEQLGAAFVVLGPVAGEVDLSGASAVARRRRRALHRHRRLQRRGRRWRRLRRPPRRGPRLRGLGRWRRLPGPRPGGRHGAPGGGERRQAGGRGPRRSGGLQRRQRW